MMWLWIAIVVAIAVVAGYWLSSGSAARARRGPFKSDATERDPVCGMDVDVAHAAARHEHGGQIFWFCSLACKEKFDANPDQYATSRAAERPVKGT